MYCTICLKGLTRWSSCNLGVKAWPLSAKAKGLGHRAFARMWVWIRTMIVGLLSLSKTLQLTCFSSPRSKNGYLWPSQVTIFTWLLCLDIATVVLSLAVKRCTVHGELIMFNPNHWGILARNLPESSKIHQCTSGTMPLSSKCTCIFVDLSYSALMACTSCQAVILPHLKRWKYQFFDGFGVVKVNDFYCKKVPLVAIGLKFRT